MIHAIVMWSDESGSTYTWPQAMVDNRRSRVLARIRRYGIPCDPTTVVITHVREA